ncbi:hypothetical protein K439DRAFT_770904 [Ramaria rubella]|nr:hypothetical protein K439DRAFT_770904 [Ramaria rubella]
MCDIVTFHDDHNDEQLCADACTSFVAPTAAPLHCQRAPAPPRHFLSQRRHLPAHPQCTPPLSKRRIPILTKPINISTTAHAITPSAQLTSSHRIA